MLFISNFSTERCGVRIFGELWVEALRRAGVHIDTWDGCYSQVVEFGYLPWLKPTLPRLLDGSGYDLVHLNWDPQTINHYLPEHFAGGPPLSLFLHDVPPNSTCPVQGVAKLVMSYEPAEGSVVIEHAVPAWEHRVPPGGCGGLVSRPVIGVTGIRGDPGAKLVQELCARRGWHFNEPEWWGGSDRFLPVEDEIHRLAHSDVNVCWYHTSGRGKSMAAMFCVAAGRPLVLSGSSMFSNLWPYASDVYYAGWTHPEGRVDEWAFKDGLEIQVTAALHERKLPTRAAAGLSWDTRALEIKTLWEEAAR